MSSKPNWPLCLEAELRSNRFCAGDVQAGPPLFPSQHQPRHTTMRSLLHVLALMPLSVTAQSYFQQQVDYRINVRLDDVAHVLHANGSFTYTNNSSTTLDTLWLHLWPNAYRDKHTALCKQLANGGDLDLHFATEEERGYIDSLDFRSDNGPLVWGYHPEHADIGWVKLSTALVPGDTITISTPFRVKIPDGKFSRLGHTKQAYYITQWYPKPAVFDAQGWHAMPYLTQGEFYSEFGSFDVSITLPDNYVVGATGLLQNAEEKERLERMAGNDWPYPKPVTDPRTGKTLRNAFPASSTTTKTLRYVQDQVHDFAWFADKRFIVRKSEVVLARSGRTVTTWALFTPRNAELWSDAVRYVNESVRLYSQFVGDYPYEACTAVDGTISAGGGMEYPMITIIGEMGDKQTLDNVIAHEVGHNWFYGILGSNERDHAWMDEGMNSFVELRYMRERYPKGDFSISLPVLKNLTKGISDAHHAQSEFGYRLNARRNLDQPLSLTSGDFTMVNYGTMVYMKTALVMDHLMAYLGEETMDRCLHAYFEEWKFKHPQPQDLRAVFERESGKNLAWIFGQFLGTTQKFDAKALRLRTTGASVEAQGNSLIFRSKGPKNILFPVTGYHQQDSLGTLWLRSSGTGRKEEEPLPWKNADRVRIDAGNRTLDIDRRNNEVRGQGLFKRCKGPSFVSLIGLEKNDRRSIYYNILPAWNGNDGFQIGAALRNTTFPSQRTEWVLAPLYGVTSERWGGAGRIEHHFDRMQSRVFQNIRIGVSARSASTFRDHDDLAWYGKVSPYVHFDLKRNPLNKPWQHRISLRGVYLNNGSQFQNSDGSMTTGSNESTYSEIHYRAENKSKLHPTLFQPTLTGTSEWLRASVEVRQGFAYNARNKQLRLRAFAGKFLVDPQNGFQNGLDAWGLTWGTQDMLYDHAYLERNARDPGLARQFNTQQGGFKTPFLQGGSEDWIASLNVELDMPFRFPLAFFASIGAVPISTRTQQGISTSAGTYLEAGVGMPVVRDVLEVWFPFYVSQRIADEEEFLGRIASDRIRFIFALEKLDPTKLLRGLKP